MTNYQWFAVCLILVVVSSFIGWLIGLVFIHQAHIKWKLKHDLAKYDPKTGKLLEKWMDYE